MYLFTRIKHYEIKKIISIWNKEELPEEWKESITVPIYTNKTECSNFTTTYKLLSNILLSRLTPYETKLLRNINVDFGARDQLLIMYSAFVKYRVAHEMSYH